jgi:hypothetical protein
MLMQHVLGQKTDTGEIMEFKEDEALEAFKYLVKENLLKKKLVNSLLLAESFILLCMILFGQ